MSEFGLITQRAYLEAEPSHPDIHYLRVVGVTMPQAPTITEYGYTKGPDTTEDSYGLSDEMSLRIADFYEQTLAKDPNERRFFYCHAFTAYALGKMVRLAEPKLLDMGDFGFVAPDNHLKAGTPYYTFSTEDGADHSFIGINDPTSNLSVLGTGQPLAISKNEALLRLYGAESVLEISPDQLVYDPFEDGDPELLEDD